MSNPAPARGAHEHDHRHCVANALAVASALCERRGVRLTALRQRVLELVWHSHAPIGAYDILDRLRIEDGRPAAPPTVYRALEFLMQQKLIHRIESLNAFVGCIDPSRPHSAQYLICRDCGTVTELEDHAVADAIAGQAARQGFAIDRQTVEVHGLCGHCAKAPQDSKAV
jgi:Fur family zinc uptake transcriptional regulator